MLVEFKTSIGYKKQIKQLTEQEFKAVNDAINKFEEDNPRRKKLVIDFDFIVPLLQLLRNDEDDVE